MIVFVEHSVMEDTMLTSNSGFMEIREKLKSFQDGKDDLTDKIDFIICLGGDGTLLYASLLFQVCKITILLCNVLRLCLCLEICTTSYGVPFGFTWIFNTF